MGSAADGVPAVPAGPAAPDRRGVGYERRGHHQLPRHHRPLHLLAQVHYIII
jgi:hypothetical protein